MTDWSNFLKTNEFRDYRKKQVEAIAISIENLLYKTVIGPEGVETINNIDGQLSMAKTLLKLPEQLTKDGELSELLEIQLIEDIANLTKALMRQRLV